MTFLPTAFSNGPGDPNFSRDGTTFALDGQPHAYVGAIPISGDALYGEGTARTPSADAEGNVRLRDPGLGIGEEGDPALTLSATSPGAVGVRRLTPTECERLQGFPDDWTRLGDTPDSRRYSALGDAVTVNVAEWIGGRLAA